MAIKVKINSTSNNDTLIHKFYGDLNKSKRLVLIIPNCYGHLKYLDTLCKNISSYDTYVVLSSFRGQSGSTGILNLRGAAIDFQTSYEIALKIAKTRNLSLNLINHCSGFVPMLLASKHCSNFEKLSTFILYSYLANIHQFIPITEKKMDSFFIDYKKDWYEGHEEALGMVKNIHCNTKIVHPTIKTSIARANRDQVEKLCEELPDASLEMPSYGYEILNFAQHKSVSAIVGKHFANHLSF